MVVTLGQQYYTGEKPTVMLYTYINRHGVCYNIVIGKEKHNSFYKSAFIVRGIMSVETPETAFFERSRVYI